MKNKITISSFPNDNKIRVIYRYGGIKKTFLGNSLSPCIQALLIELDDNKNLVQQNFLTVDIKIKDLHKAKLGSVWQGQILLSNDYKLHEKIRSRGFIFRLDYNPAKNVDFNFIKTLFNNTNCFIGISDYLNFSSTYRGEKKIIDKLRSFDNVNYACLKSTKKDNVYISSVDILNSLFCRNTVIKEKLLYTSINDIVNQYLEEYKRSEGRHQNYKIKLKNRQKKLADGTLTFLAFLALNRDVQNKVRLMQYSLEDIKFNVNDYKYVDRFPIILPPQTCELRVNTLGFGYGNHFVVTKIKSYDAIYDRLVLHEYNKDQNSYYNSIYNSF